MLHKTNVFNLPEAKGLHCKISKWMVTRLSLNMKAPTNASLTFFLKNWLFVKSKGTSRLPQEADRAHLAWGCVNTRICFLRTALHQGLQVYTQMTLTSLYNILLWLSSILSSKGTFLFSKSPLTTKFKKLISEESFHQRTSDIPHTWENSAWRSLVRFI